jgi:predicted transposase/invertase (TIGR01784 family)
MAISKFLDPKNDFAFKKIFGSEKNKDILIHFINDMLEFKEAEKIQDITYLSPIQDPEIASKKQSIVDILCVAVNGEQIIVEMQVSPQIGFEKRAQYYAAKAYARQLNRGSEEGSRYQDLKKIIFIAICDKIIFKDKSSYISQHIIFDKATYTNDLKDFSFTFVELPKFSIKEIDKLNTIIEKWCYFFKYAPNTKESELCKIIGLDHVIERAYQELNQFNWTEQELFAYEEEQKRMMDNEATEEYFFSKRSSRRCTRRYTKRYRKRPSRKYVKNSKKTDSRG